MSSSVAAKNRLDEEVCNDAMKFVKLYVDSADIRREKMHVLYSTAEPSLIWNGNNVDGLQNIQSFWSNLPATEHEYVLNNGG